MTSTLGKSLATVTALGREIINEDSSKTTQFDLKVKLKVDYAYFQMESMLSSIGNKLINNNYRSFLEELVPGLEDSLARIFADIVNSILKDSTYDEMFPEIEEITEENLKEDDLENL